MPSSASKILPAGAAAYLEAQSLLKQGEVVALPSETVYGLAGSAFDSQACARIFSAKQRPAFDPLIVHIPKSWGSLSQLNEKGLIDLSKIAEPLQKKIQVLIENFWPGPLTIVFAKGKKIPDIVTNALPSVAIRMPAHPVFQAVLESTQLPLAAPSANLFAHVSPTSAKHVLDDLSGKIPLIIDGGPCQFGVESTIIGFDEQQAPVLLRRGSLALEEIKGKTGWTEIPPIQSGAAISAPGALDRHYAPAKPLFLSLPDGEWSMPQSFPAVQKAAIVSLFANRPVQASAQEGLVIQERFFLSSDPDLDPNGLTAAQNLFSILRLLEKADIDVILVETPRQTQGLWPAIQDRLTKARYQGESKSKDIL